MDKCSCDVALWCRPISRDNRRSRITADEVGRYFATVHSFGALRFLVRCAMNFVVLHTMQPHL